MGIDSEIYVETARRVEGIRAHPYRQYDGAPTRGKTWLLYQLSTGSAVADFLQSRPESKLVNYHNITTTSLYAPWEPHVGVQLDAGRRQLCQLAAHADLGIAVSSYNERELKAVGYSRTAVSPVLADLDHADRAADQRVLSELEEAKAGGGPDWLFVGRIAPQKCQHEVVKSFAAYRRVYSPRARLHLVGGCGSSAYLTALQRYIAALGLAGAVRLTGSVSQAALVAHYRAADVLVCLSEHEGFCIPLVEAMRYEVPVVAFGAAAVPETVAGGGILLTSKDPGTVAAAVDRVLTDAELRLRLIDAGRARAALFTLDRAAARFRQVISDFLRDSE